MAPFGVLHGRLLAYVDGRPRYEGWRRSSSRGLSLPFGVRATQRSQDGAWARKQEDQLLVEESKWGRAGI